MGDIEYPTRCRVMDIEGQSFYDTGLTMRTPPESRPHVGKEGLAELLPFEDAPDETYVRLTLDDGTVLHGWDCWWEPLGKELRDGT